MNSGALGGTGLQWLDGKNTGWETGPASARPLNRHEHLKHRCVSLCSPSALYCAWYGGPTTIRTSTVLSGSRASL